MASKLGKGRRKSHIYKVKNDTMPLCEDLMMEVENVKGFIRCFEFAFGLRSDTENNTVVGIDISQETTEVLVQTMNCKIH